MDSFHFSHNTSCEGCVHLLGSIPLLDLTLRRKTATEISCYIDLWTASLLCLIAGTSKDSNKRNVMWVLDVSASLNSCWMSLCFPGNLNVFWAHHWVSQVVFVHRSGNHGPRNFIFNFLLDFWLRWIRGYCLHAFRSVEVFGLGEHLSTGVYFLHELV